MGITLSEAINSVIKNYPDCHFVIRKDNKKLMTFDSKKGLLMFVKTSDMIMLQTYLWNKEIVSYVVGGNHNGLGVATIRVRWNLPDLDGDNVINNAITLGEAVKSYMDCWSFNTFTVYRDLGWKENAVVCCFDVMYGVVDPEGTVPKGVLERLWNEEIILDKCRQTIATDCRGMHTCDVSLYLKKKEPKPNTIVIKVPKGTKVVVEEVDQNDCTERPEHSC